MEVTVLHYVCNCLESKYIDLIGVKTIFDSPVLHMVQYVVRREWTSGVGALVLNRACFTMVSQ